MSYVERLEDQLAGLEIDCDKMQKRINELEDGSCRFNCKAEKEAFIAGFLWEDEEVNGFDAYKEWKCEK
ncbi:MAG: hypothetical protein E4G89_05030 [Methanothrix sp.]|nr:MAG: hypothetical protein E4G89_05030 [Methanothrix sp.]